MFVVEGFLCLMAGVAFAGLMLAIAMSGAAPAAPPSGLPRRRDGRGTGTGRASTDAAAGGVGRSDIRPSAGAGTAGDGDLASFDVVQEEPGERPGEVVPAEAELLADCDVPRLVRGLWSTDAGSRVRAADELGRRAGRAASAVHALRTVALRDEDETVRKSAAYALLLILPDGRFGAPARR